MESSIPDSVFDHMATYAAVVATLRRLPKAPTLTWYSPHVSAELPCRAGWVDVMVDDLAACSQLHWIWTIEQPGARREDMFGVHVPYDSGLFVYGSWAEDRIDAAELVTPTVEHDLSAETAHPTLLDEMLLMDEIPDRPGWLQREVWSPEAISRGLVGWCREHTGRSDIDFRWLGTAREWWSDDQIARTLDQFRPTTEAP